jgi:hypothetical protein
MAFGGASDLPYMNEPMPCGNLFGAGLSLVPLWDDLDAQTGGVFWQVNGTAPNRTLIVEWYNRPHYPGDSYLNGDEVTFQAQIYETLVSHVLAQFLYLDTDFQNWSYNNGASATVGFQLDGARGRQWSFNQPAVDPGVVLSICAAGTPGSRDDNHDGIPDECQGLKGDLDCDGAVRFADIDPFVLALQGYGGYSAEYPDCEWLNADCDCDGLVRFTDINRFVEILQGGQPCGR